MTNTQIIETTAGKLFNQIARIGEGTIETAGSLRLAGPAGGSTTITGEIYISDSIPGMIVFETEHGSLYLPADEEIHAIVDYEEEKLPAEVGSAGYLVSWNIDEDEDQTPAQAAWSVWRKIFGRGIAAANDACVFEVKDWATGTSFHIDLSETDAPEESETAE